MTSAMLVILCGVSFAGKSTLADGLAEILPARVVSLDAINAERGLWGGGGIAVEEWIATNGIAEERVSEQLRAGENVIVDDTTSLRSLRDGWRALARSEDADHVLIWVTIDPMLQRQRVEENRSRQRRGDVLDDVLDAHLADFEEPSDDESAVLVDAPETRDPESLSRIVEELRRRFHP